MVGKEETKNLADSNPIATGRLVETATKIKSSGFRTKADEVRVRACLPSHRT
jgi:hypothetical protein